MMRGKEVLNAVCEYNTQILKSGNMNGVASVIKKCKERK